MELAVFEGQSSSVSETAQRNGKRGWFSLVQCLEEQFILVHKPEFPGIWGAQGCYSPSASRKTGTINCSLAFDEALMDWLSYNSVCGRKMCTWPLFHHIPLVGKMSNKKWQVWHFCSICKPVFISCFQGGHWSNYRWMAEEYGSVIKKNMSWSQIDLGSNSDSSIY